MSTRAEGAASPLPELKPRVVQEDNNISALTPKQKAAVLFMSLPPEMSAQLFSELGPEEVQAITLEITQLPSIAPEVRASVINEFLNSSQSAPAATQAAMPAAAFTRVGGGETTVKMRVSV